MRIETQNSRYSIRDCICNPLNLRQMCIQAELLDFIAKFRLKRYMDFETSQMNT
jgi:hypothetical protein